MQTALDTRHELERISLKYNGQELVAEVCELIVGPGGLVSRDHQSYAVSFIRPQAHALTEEFPAIYGNWLDDADSGFLRRVKNSGLRAAMGLNLEQFENQNAYLLITAHEILAVFCENDPIVESLNG